MESSTASESNEEDIHFGELREEEEEEDGEVAEAEAEAEAEATEEEEEALEEVRMRLRRVKSTSRAEEIVTEDEKLRRAQPDKPIHKPIDSIFSWSSGFQNFEGIMNWAFLILSLGGIRLFLENLNKYGVRVNPRFWISIVFGNVTDHHNGEYPTLYLILFTNVIILFTLAVEKLLANKWINWSIGVVLHGVNLSMVLIIPVVVINFKYEFIGPANATIICGLYAIAFLKMWSYVQVNLWCRYHQRHLGKSFANRFKSPSLVEFPRNREGMGFKSRYSAKKYSKQKLVHYPDNLTVKDLYYFWLAPTLCYELNFPKMDRIRKFFLIRRALEVIIGTNIVLALIQQWIIPSVAHTLIPFSTMDFSKGTERVLKLAIPNHLIWLTWFYLLFHSFLNSLGEVLQFADREFYRDWWNANNILVFWKNWNLPVHRWCVRHVFKPLLRNGYSVNMAQLVVFLISAFFHEYLVSVPLRVFKAYAFVGMLMQFPLIYVSHFLEVKLGPRAGNLCVWVSLIIGQPLAIMMYYHDFIVEHYGKELINYYGRIVDVAGAAAAR